MSLLDDILMWTETTLPRWQQDAARRLFQNDSALASDDYEELYALLKASHGLPNPRNLTPVPLSATHLPAAVEANSPVVLKAMRDLKNANRIASGQRLDFAPTGMTVIYGGNGTGKSGYARVMKRACRARDQSEQVHPDANDPKAETCIPEATFDIEIGGVAKSVGWTARGLSPDELSTVAVFDCHCARAYVTSEQDVAYLPYGLDVVENLANKVLPELSRRLDIEIAGVDVDAKPYAYLQGSTEVGQLISALSEKTPPAKIKALGTLSARELERMAELDSALAEADPTAKAKHLRLSAARLKALTKRVDSVLALVSDAAIVAIKNLEESVVAAGRAEEQAAGRLRAGDALLPGTGESVWKVMFDAARKFSTEFAYPGIDFPNTGAGAVCPLCQTPLGGAGERLRRFETYVREDVAKVAARRRQQMSDEREKFGRANVDIGLDTSLAGELAMLNANVASSVVGFQTTLDARRKWIKKAFVSHTWDNMPAVGENPRGKLRGIAAGQLRLARTFERAADEIKSKDLKIKRDELRARQKLGACADALLGLIERMKIRGLLEACKKDLKTKSISDKSKELAANAVTASLKSALDDEFMVLGIGHIGTKLKNRTDKGRVKLRLVLDLPASNKLEEILSEGEQRAIALGSFLAELKLANHTGAIVFDDPVSSLDHKHRRNVANRLSQESLRRQVLVFTHDVVFLHQLLDALEQRGTRPAVCFLESRRGYSGFVAAGLPWDLKTFRERIDKLEKKQKELERLPWPADPPEELSREIVRQYSFLRATIERVVQDFVLNSTVRRFHDYIEVKNLRLVVGLDTTEVDELLRVYQRCHGVVEAHDRSFAKDDPPPDPYELQHDIGALKKVIAVIKDRRNKAKSAAGPSGPGK